MYLLVDGTSYELTGDRVVLGRSRTADIVVSDPSVSRQHCELRRDGDGWTAVDLGSTNGSQLNGESLAEPRRLASGMRIKLGHAAAIIEVR
jgi:pSer/pThr/pTyr-binding forkhead associated (FHA) protein